MMGCNMNEMRFLEIKQDIFGKNNDAAAAFRSARKEDGMLYIDVMASPGAGKTTLLLTIMAKLRERGSQDLGRHRSRSGIRRRCAEDQGSRRRFRRVEHPRRLPCGNGHGGEGLCRLRIHLVRVPVPGKHRQPRLLRRFRHGAPMCASCCCRCRKGGTR